MRIDADFCHGARPQLAAVNAHDLCRALGPRGEPATIAVRCGVVTVTTPTGTATVKVTAAGATPIANPTASLPPHNADVLRVALDRRHETVRLAVRGLSLTLTTSDGDVTIERW
jgi:hypothetical protein